MSNKKSKIVYDDEGEEWCPEFIKEDSVYDPYLMEVVHIGSEEFE